MIVLDAHVLVWAAGDDRKLGRKARTLIQQLWPAERVAVSAIVFWEIGLLQACRRLKLPSTLLQWRESVLSAGTVELPVDGNVVMRAHDLAGLHDDPADRFIVATALVHGAALMTADERLLDCRHALERYDARK